MNVVIEVRGSREAARALEALMDGLPGACAAGLDEGLAGMLDGAPAAMSPWRRAT